MNWPKIVTIFMIIVTICALGLWGLWAITWAVKSSHRKQVQGCTETCQSEGYFGGHTQEGECYCLVKHPSP